MKIGDLRHILQVYDKIWSFRKLLKADKDGEKYRQYLQKFATLADDDELLAQDIFRLLQAIPELVTANTDLAFLFKDRLNNSYLLEVYDVLNSSGLMTEAYFLVIYHNLALREFLYKVFCDPLGEKIPLNLQIFKVVLHMATQPSPSFNSIEACLRFLHAKKNLTPAALDLLMHTTDAYILNLLPLLQQLAQAHCLNDSCLAQITACPSRALMHTLLRLLNQAKISLNNESIKSICTYNSIPYLAEFLEILVNSKSFYLTPEIFTMLLQKDWYFLWGKRDILTFLQKNDLLDNVSFNYLCTETMVTTILGILLHRSLLNDKQLVLSLFKDDLDKSRFCHAMTYLNKIDLLDQDTLIQGIKWSKKIAAHSLFSPNIFSLFEENNFKITKEQFRVLCTLSPANIQRLYQVLSNLITRHRFDEAAFTIALQKITEKLPQALECQVLAREKINDSSIQFTIKDKPGFFIKDIWDYESGGYGKVIRGYASLDSSEPQYGIKILKESKLEKARKEARREVKYHQLLGRTAFYFSQPYSAIVFDWQQEKSLDHYSAHELLQVPLKTRLSCLKSGVKDLNILHTHYRVHGDIKQQNIIIDLKNGAMKLIDFGSSHKKGLFKHFGSIHLDLYAMSLIIKAMFPDIFPPLIGNRSPLPPHQSPLSTMEQALVNLVEALQHSNNALGCTSENAFNYLKELIENFDNIDELFLQKITDTTLYYNNQTVENFLLLS